jgi:hypothetical protein
MLARPRLVRQDQVGCEVANLERLTMTLDSQTGATDHWLSSQDFRIHSDSFR